MPDSQTSSKNLNRDMERVINDTEHFLEDLKGQKHLKKLLKKDIHRLREHLHGLIDHISHLEEDHTV